MPRVNWKTHMPKFRDEKGDNVALHLIKFYMHVCRLEVQFHEDSLMKMFMETLEDNARSWYEGLQLGSLCSLKDFYSVFCGNYKESHSAIVLIEKLCGNFKNSFHYMGIDIDDKDLMDDGIEEALLELFSHQEEIIEDIFHHTQQNFQQTILSSIAEDEMEQNFDEDIHFSSPVFNDHI